MIEVREIRHWHGFCGLGGGAGGFNRGRARVGNMVAKFRCIGGVDVDAAAVVDFGRLAGVPGTVLDLFSREQYLAFHGKEPPAGWRAATAADIRRSAGNERPHIVFLSAPCKGFSGLLSQTRSLSAKYQALNALTLRGVWLMLEAWADDPPELVLFENVPRISSRGRQLLDQIGALLRQYGYAVAETAHDCGEIGGLAQSRRRFLLVARHQEKVPPFLYEPVKRPLRAVGEVLDKFPLPGDPRGGPMHRIPALQWKTWVRLAFVEAGSDWRSLNRLKVTDGVLADYLLVPEMYGTVYGVRHWGEPAGTVTSESRPSNGKFSVADPRTENFAGGKYRITGYDEPAGTVIAASTTGNGAFAVADPRIVGHPKSVQMGVRRWDQPAGVVTGKMFAGGGPNAVADPRLTGVRHNNVYRVVRYGDTAPSVTGGTGPSAGALNVADPRPAFARGGRHDYLTGGHYGVVPWNRPAYAVTGAGSHDNGPHNVADPRLPEATERLVAVIRAEDGTWHRPFTTLECAALQSLVDPDEYLQLEGESDSAHRERIGNAVPREAAEAIAGVFGRTILLAWSGETFTLDSQPVWVRPIAVALAVRQP